MIEYQAIGAVVVTAKNDGAQAGAVCRYHENDTVTAASAADPIHGICVYEKNGLASVQVKGFVTLPYTGTAPGVGYAQLAANGSGGVQTASSGPLYLVAKVDTAAYTVTFCM